MLGKDARCSRGGGKLGKSGGNAERGFPGAVEVRSERGTAGNENGSAGRCAGTSDPVRVKFCGKAELNRFGFLKLARFDSSRTQIPFLNSLSPHPNICGGAAQVLYLEPVPVPGIGQGGFLLP